MVLVTNLKNGSTFLFEGKPCQVVKYFHQKIGRGGATVRLTFRNLETGDLVERAFQSTAKFEEISTTKKQLQYLYSDSTNAIFMDPATFEQIEVSIKILGDDINFIKEGEEANVLFWDDKPLSVEIPPKIVLKVIETAPGVKGNTTSNIYKPAKLENGLSVKVPLFIKADDFIRVDTRTGEYIERVVN